MNSKATKLNSTDAYNRRMAEKEKEHNKGTPLFANADGQTIFARRVRRKAPPKHKEIHDNEAE